MTGESRPTRGDSSARGPDWHEEHGLWLGRTTSATLVTTIIATIVVVLLSPTEGVAQSAYESYYSFLGDYPDEAENEWSVEAQGLTHDDTAWYVTQKGALWKFPVDVDLADPPTPGTGGVERTLLVNCTELVLAGYNHFGDLSYLEYAGQGFLFIPVECVPNCGGPPPAIAAFRADTLQYLDHFSVAQRDAPWCAALPPDMLYSSDFNGSMIERYVVSWQHLVGTPPVLLLETLVPPLYLYDEEGIPLSVQAKQGGAISPNGQLLYLTTGSLECHADHGIHVFDLSSGRRVQRSTNGSGYFNYQFNCALNEEEPEGITIWDLDGGEAPGIAGQLHVLLLDNDEWPHGDDDIYIKHYTQTIYVDDSYGGPGNGTPAAPFNTVGEANDLAWDGARISVRAGSYPEMLTFSTRMLVRAEGGIVVIGAAGGPP